MYRRYYFEVIDRIVGEIERRFQSSTFSFYANIERVLQLAAKDKVNTFLSK